MRSTFIFRKAFERKIRIDWRNYLNWRSVCWTFESMTSREALANTSNASLEECRFEALTVRREFIHSKSTLSWGDTPAIWRILADWFWIWFQIRTIIAQIFIWYPLSIIHESATLFVWFGKFIEVLIWIARLSHEIASFSFSPEEFRCKIFIYIYPESSVFQYSNCKNAKILASILQRRSHLFSISNSRFPMRSDLSFRSLKTKRKKKSYKVVCLII